MSSTTGATIRITTPCNWKISAWPRCNSARRRKTCCSGEDSLRIRDYFAADGSSRIERFAFADKTISLDDIRRQSGLDTRSAVQAQQLINAMAAFTGAQAAPAQIEPHSSNLLTPPLLINPLQMP